MWDVGVTDYHEIRRMQGGDPDRNANAAIERSGLRSFSTGVRLGDLEPALQYLREFSKGADALDRELLRGLLIEELRRLELSGPARLANGVVARNPGDSSSPSPSLPFRPVEPWPTGVVLCEVLAGIQGVLNKYLALPAGAAEAVVLWIAFAHAHDAFQISPILAITSPEKRCGKTTLLELIDGMAPRALLAANITSATLFRIIDAHSPTLLIDEADTFLGDKDELRGILNSGHRRASAQVFRTVGDNHEPRRFRTWAPKVVACIGRLPDTLEDRSVRIPMRRRRREESVSRLRQDRLGLELEPIRCQLSRWAADHAQVLRGADPVVPEGLSDRAADNWRPLLAIAEAAGGDWPSRGRAAAAGLSGSRIDEGTPTALLLVDIRTEFDRQGVDRIPSQELIDVLTARDDRPWAEWRNDRPLTQVQLARMLGRFEIRPKVIRFGLRTVRGYERESFADAWARYLPDDPQHLQHPTADADSPDSEGCNGDVSVADGHAPSEGLPGWVVSGVSDQGESTAAHDGYEEIEREAIEEDEEGEDV
ncbi:MAG: DUF3631 domain-containing protein [Phycisphaerales bacterium]|nr:DUF3631 domain-containing protein [Phycisphaerales bacterium]